VVAEIEVAKVGVETAFFEPALDNADLVAGLVFVQAGGGNAGGNPFHAQSGGGIPVVLPQVHGKGGVHIAGEHYQVSFFFAGPGVQQKAALHRVALPHVHAFGIAGHLGRIVVGRENDLVANQLPAGLGIPDLIDKPGSLGLAEHGSEAVLAQTVLAIADLRTPPFQSSVQKTEVGKGPQREGAPNTKIRVVRYRQGFEIGLQSRLFAEFPRPFGGILVILSPGDMGIVGNFVVVPNGDQGMAASHFLKVGIQMVLGVAGAVILKADDFAGRPVLADKVLLAVSVGFVFVDIIPKVQNGIDVVHLGQGTVGIEIPPFQVAARSHPEGDLVHGCSKSSGSACWRDFAVPYKAIVQAGRFGEFVHLHLDGVGNARVGGCRTLPNHLLKKRIRGNLPGTGHLLVRCRVTCTLQPGGIRIKGRPYPHLAGRRIP